VVVVAAAAAVAADAAAVATGAGIAVAAGVAATVAAVAAYKSGERGARTVVVVLLPVVVFGWGLVIHKWGRVQGVHRCSSLPVLALLAVPVRHRCRRLGCCCCCCCRHVVIDDGKRSWWWWWW